MSRFGVLKDKAPALLLVSMQTTSTVQTLRDYQLLARVAHSDGDEHAARQAQAAFYNRHVRYLYAALCKPKRLLELAGETPEDLVQDTFARAFERAHTYQALESADADRERRRTRAWLGRIAHCLLADRLRGERTLPDSPYLESLGSDAVDDVASESPALGRVRLALSEMSERERDVLRVTALYYRAGHDTQRLPNRASDELAKRWQTTNQNIRAIRSRALKKLRALVGAPERESMSLEEA
jgi:RNA polymerase sigma factor (sigma-70 family)